MKKFFVILIVFTIFSCKDEKSIDSLEVVKPEAVIDNDFKITVNVIVKKDDDFCLFYTEDGTSDFKNEPIWTGIKGSESVQPIVYTLPKEVFPTQLRLDFGLKKDQEDIVFKSIVLEYKGKNREISGSELVKFFRADEKTCKFDASTGIIKAAVKDGVRVYPSLYPIEENLGAEIKKLAQ